MVVKVDEENVGGPWLGPWRVCAPVMVDGGQALQRAASMLDGSACAGAERAGSTCAGAEDAGEAEVGLSLEPLYVLFYSWAK